MSALIGTASVSSGNSVSPAATVAAAGSSITCVIHVIHVTRTNESN